MGQSISVILNCVLRTGAFFVNAIRAIFNWIVIAFAILRLKQSQQIDRFDYYEILGVNYNASSDELRKAHKKMCLQHHPDKVIKKKNEENKEMLEEKEERIKLINEAYRVVSNPSLRKIYDQGGESAVKRFELTPKYKRTISERFLGRGGKMDWAYTELSHLFDDSINGKIVLQTLPSELQEVLTEYGLNHIGRSIELAFKANLRCQICGQQMRNLDQICVCHLTYQNEGSTHCFEDECCPLKMNKEEQPFSISSWLQKFNCRRENKYSQMVSLEL